MGWVATIDPLLDAGWSVQGRYGTARTGHGLYGRGLRGVPVVWLSYRWKHRSAQPTSVESGLKAHMRLPAVERRDLTIRVKSLITRQYTPIVLEVASKLTRIPNTICINLTVCLFVGLNLSPKVKN